MLIISDKAKRLIERLNNPRFTVSYIEKYINSDDLSDSVKIAGCLGFLLAVNEMVALEEREANNAG